MLVQESAFGVTHLFCNRLSFLLVLAAVFVCQVAFGTAPAAQEALKEALRDRLGIGGVEAPPPPIENGVPFAIRFDNQVRGLTPGASVEVKGIRIGEVCKIDLSYTMQSATVLPSSSIWNCNPTSFRRWASARRLRRRLTQP